MEVAWRDNFRRWMSFINDFKNAGGRLLRLGLGIHLQAIGFGYIRELEMLRRPVFIH